MDVVDVAGLRQVYALETTDASGVAGVIATINHCGESSECNKQPANASPLPTPAGAPRSASTMASTVVISCSSTRI